jgi:ABC-type transport system involved in multi-copper enzyme maturation permease subunit
VTRVVAAELLKLRTTRTFWGLALSALGLVLLIVVLNLALDDNLRSAGEYRHGTIASTLLVTPQRLRAVSATVLACCLGGLAIGVVVTGLTAAIAIPWLSARDAVLPSTGDLLKTFLGGILYGALAAGLGAAFGSLLRNQVAAVVIVLVLIFIVDPAIVGLLENVGQFTLTGLGIAMSGGDNGDENLLPQGLAAVVWALYTLLLTALAAFFTARRDI